MERAGSMKKFLANLFICGLIAAPSYAQQYDYVKGNENYTIEMPKQEQGDIFNQVKTPEQPSKDDVVKVEMTKNEKIAPVNLKKKYKNITKSEKLVEAIELLRDCSAGSFPYSSIHGNNNTYSCIKVEFLNMAKDKEHQTDDAYGVFEGKKYVIYVNSVYENSPAGAIAPTIAREALVKKDKSEADKEMATQMQIAIWTQLCGKISGLESKNDDLVRLQNRLKSGVSLDDYSGFLNEEEQKKHPIKDPNTSKSKKSKGKGNPVQKDFDVDYQKESEQIDSTIMSFDSKSLQKKYKKVTDEDRIIEALELLKNTVGKFSYEAILQRNLTHKPMQIQFKKLEEINPKYASFDALGWKHRGKLKIYINSKHVDAPAAALAALLSHEALHQDEFDSLNEETYAWTMEASVWTQLCDQQPNVSKINHPLVTRENMLKQLFEKGDYSSKYIKKSVFSNPSYSKLPIRSPGFEEDL